MIVTKLKTSHYRSTKRLYLKVGTWDKFTEIWGLENLLYNVLLPSRNWSRRVHSYCEVRHYVHRQLVLDRT